MSDAFLAAAWSIGVRLCRDALWDGERCNWLGDSMEPVGGDWRVVHRAFGPDFYAGTSGIALFLARLHRRGGEGLFRTTALGAARHAISRLDDVSGPAQTGFYGGLAGIAYALDEAGELLDAPELTSGSRRALRALGGHDPKTGGLDVIGGSAGIIPVLLMLHPQHPDLGLRDLAVRHGGHLLETAHRDEAGWSWDTLGVPGQRDLTGFSHGTAGIGWALLELHRATAQPEFAAAAGRAFDYERHWFDRRQGNWPDFRAAAETAGTPPGCSVAWCHGAPGIGLSRLRAYRLTGDPAFLEETRAAVAATTSFLRQALGGGAMDFSLCHGLSGDAEFLLEASAVLAEPEHAAFAREIGRTGIERYAGQAWPCGVPGGGETPNLMLGLAGIGHFFLRLHDPATGSVLMVGPGG
ncbi:MAG: lanthionine synthetase LanC family protein [Acetobacteraceae bacterium]